MSYDNKNRVREIIKNRQEPWASDENLESGGDAVLGDLKDLLRMLADYGHLGISKFRIKLEAIAVDPAKDPELGYRVKYYKRHGFKASGRFNAGLLPMELVNDDDQVELSQ